MKKNMTECVIVLVMLPAFTFAVFESKIGEKNCFG